MPKKHVIQADDGKVLVRLDLSMEVLDYFKSRGPGWQTRIDRALQAFVEAAK